MTDKPRNLIVLSDGTGNSASTPFKTNVWRLYQALDLENGKQVALFGDGVGTSSIKILRVIGLALGVGVKRNVLDLYKFLCRNYQRGDRIWIFGFSRGAFTVRALAGLIHSQGLISCTTEAELEYSALAAYRAYRADAFDTMIPWVKVGRAGRDLCVRFWRWVTDGTQYADIQKRTVAEGRGGAQYADTAKRTLKPGSGYVPIHFIGVWDTVVAYGLPIDELTIAVDKWVWPMKFRDTSLLPIVRHARHALALDDERRTFHPVPWDERDEKKSRGAVDPDRLLQVWFAGMHADVGGGYPDDGLAFVPLCWMLDHAKAKGLVFEDRIVETYRALAAPTGRMYDSRAGGGVLWRYQPRNVQFLMHRSEDEYLVPAAERVTPLVHHSAVTRMIYGNDGYAPISLPLDIKIVLPDDTPVLFADQPVKDQMAAVASKISAAKPDDVHALKHVENVLKDVDAAVQCAAAIPREDRLALVLDTVWFRRIVYFVTLILALVALAYPLLYEALDFADTTGKLDDAVNGSLVWSISLVRGFLPGFAAPWLDAISENGLAAVVIGLLFLFSLALSAFLQQRIHDRARAAWNVQHRGRKMERMLPTGQRHALVTLTIIGAIVSAFAIPTREQNPKLFWALVGFTGLFFVAYVIRRFVWRPQRVDAAKPWFPLSTARYLRTSRKWVGGYRWVAQKFAPLLFILAVAYLGLSLLNLGAFNAGSTLGHFCPDIPDAAIENTARNAPAGKQAPKSREQLAQDSQEEKLDGIQPIDIKSRCHPTGLKLVAGRQYRIRLETGTDWFDKSIPSDVAGFASDSFGQLLFSPLKRWWRENWFQPIARVGRYGNYEYPLKPAAPLAEANFTPCKPESPPFWTALGQAVAGVTDTVLHPGRIIDDIRNTPEPASKETMERQLACERSAKGPSDPEPKVRRTNILISDITPAHSGELFIYVNDAVLALPGLTNVFYRNNTGTAKVTVQRVVAPEIIWQGAAPAQKN